MHVLDLEYTAENKRGSLCSREEMDNTYLDSIKHTVHRRAPVFHRKPKGSEWMEWQRGARVRVGAEM